MYPASINGIIFGVVLIVFRKKVCMLLQKTYENFPKYDNGVKALNMKFTIRPIFITILGGLIVPVSIVGLFQFIGNSN
jgi:hypothetical protein